MTQPPLFRSLAILCLTACFLAAPAGTHGSWWGGVAWADDDDGGDDDGGDDDDDDGGSGASGGDDDDGPAPRARGEGRTQSPQRTQRRNVTPPRPIIVVQPPPEFAPEIVVIGLSGADLTLLLQEGFRLLERQILTGAGADILRLAPPERLALATARDRVRLMATGSNADFNHFYRANEAAVPASAPVPGAGACGHANCALHDLVKWPSVSARQALCSAAIPRIGIIDTGVNTAHDLIAGDRVEIIRLGPETEQASGQVHGTAVVSALAGRAGSRVEGLLPEAQYIVADVFSRDGSDERADVFSLIRGLALMEERGIRVVNLSLAGPDNAALAAVVRRLVDGRGTVLVAAVGNAGSDKPVAFPAAYAGVIGVTAVDRRGRLYSAAQRGAQVDIAAPGVGLVLATSIRGAKEKTGTSFAVPFVTAASALIVSANPALNADGVLMRLAATTRDMGEGGADALFGAGLLQADALCR